MLGDGRDYYRPDNDLKSTIRSYNDNFARVSKFDSTIKADLLILSHNVDNLTDFENFFQKRLLIVKI